MNTNRIFNGRKNASLRTWEVTWLMDNKDTHNLDQMARLTGIKKSRLKSWFRRHKLAHLGYTPMATKVQQSEEYYDDSKFACLIMGFKNH